MRLKHITLLVCGAAAALVAGCEVKQLAAVGDTPLAQATRVTKPAEGPTIEVGAGDIGPLPDGDVVRLAIGRTVPWQRAVQVIEQVRAAGKEPVVLVGKRFDVGAFQLASDAFEGDGKVVIKAFSYVDGKVCIQPPYAREAACVRGRKPSTVVPASYVREITRKVVRKFDLHDVLVDIPDTQDWYNAVLTIDALFTCCPGRRNACKISELGTAPGQDSSW